ncbi:MAG: hypothetical protein AAF787_11755, partial [Chloroflexota bacterium]
LKVNYYKKNVMGRCPKPRQDFAILHLLRDFSKQNHNMRSRSVSFLWRFGDETLKYLCCRGDVHRPHQAIAYDS